MERLAYQRKPGICDDCFRAGQIMQKSIHAWLLEQDVVFLSFYSEAVGHELTSDLLEQRNQFIGRRGHINQNVVAVPRRGGKYFLAQNRREEKGIPLLHGRRKE